LAEVSKEIEALDEQKKIVPEIVFFKKFLLRHQIDHLYAYKRAMVGTSYIDYLTDALHAFKSLFVRGHVTLDPVAQSILDYITTEREEIIFNYKKLLLFLVVKKDQKLPPVIDFWTNVDLIEKIKKRSKKIEQPKVQGFEVLLAIGLQAL